MPRLYNDKVRDVCGALRHEGVGPKEIVRRLNEDEAGLGHKVEIKARRVYEYIDDYNAIHGPPPGPEDKDQTLDSIARVKRRMIALIQREVTTLEKRRPGKISVKESAALRQHFATLDDMERREEQAAKRPGRRASKASSSGNGNGKSEQVETALERLAREQASRTTCQHGVPSCPCNDGDPCNYEDDPATGTKAMPPPGQAVGSAHG